MSVLVIDAGTSGVRAAIVWPDATVGHVHHREVLPRSPAAGLVEFDPVELADAALEVASATLAEAGPVEAVGVANQRASTVVWDRRTGQPVGPGLGWQDLRTVPRCLALRDRGFAVQPNATATKAAHLLDEADPARRGDLCVGTVDSWLVWNLSSGAAHVTDATNAAITGLLRADGSGWNARVLEALGIDEAQLPEVCDSTGSVAEATLLQGRPPVTGIAGDQQASLIGQGCTLPGLAKITFGTGAMLDICVGAAPHTAGPRAAAGTFPIVAWRRGGAVTWGAEGTSLAAGAAVEWLRDGLGVVDSPADCDRLAASCEETDDVWFVPALLGLGAPYWDYGARGTLLGVTRGTGPPELCRAVLEGVAHRGADLVDAAEADTGFVLRSLRVDGGMSSSGPFLQALADATGRPVEVSPVREATTLGAGFLAGMAVGVWEDDPEGLAETWEPARVVAPRQPLDRDRWHQACERAGGWVPGLSALPL